MGIDLDITKFIHDSDERAFRPIDEKEDREHIETRHQSMSCKEHESNNCQEARRRSARTYERLSNKRDAYHEALYRSYKSIRCRVSRSPERGQHDTAEREQSEYRGDVVVRDASSVQTPRQEERLSRGFCSACGTTNRCVQCDVESEKPLWVHEHSCLSCRFEVDPDQNAALEIQRLGLLELGVGVGVVEDESGLVRN